LTIIGNQINRRLKSKHIKEFWKTVEVNLRDHQVRLVFVTDSAPRELRRLVEFLVFMKRWSDGGPCCWS